MRPLKLKIKGLRSYRETQEVDFTDAGLFAIVGETGAGKSSLLEAITVALYGTCTWDGSQVKPLISDGATTLTVELTFLADGETWRVTRSMSRTNYPPSVHKLEHPASETKIDKQKAVDDKIRQLVGLDYDAFLRTVVLPQGRFAMLLQATAKERTSILKGILRVDKLDAVREQAAAALERMRPLSEDLKVRRAALLPDPKAARDEALARREEAARRQGVFGDAKAKWSAAEEAGKKAKARGDSLSALVAAVGRLDVRGAPRSLAAIAEKASEIDEKQREIRAEEEVRAGQLAALQEALSEAEKEGMGLRQLADGSAALQTLTTEVPALEREKEDLAKAEAKLAEESAGVAKMESDLAIFVEAGRVAAAEVATSKQAVESAAKTVVAVKRAHEALAAARAEAQKSREKRERAAADRDKAESVVKACEAEVAALAEKAREARAAVEQAQRKHAAHLAATGVKPSDPCPVCARALPDDFKAPKAPSLETAEKKAKKAIEEEAATREKEHKARGKWESLRDQWTALAEDLEAREAAARAAEQALSEVCPSPTTPESDIARAESARSTSTEMLLRSEEKLQGCRDAYTQAKTALDAEKKRIAAAKQDMKSRQDRIKARKKQLDETLARVPAAFRPSDAEAGPQRAPQQKGAAFAAMIGRIEVKKTQIEGLVAQREALREAVTGLQHTERELSEMRRSEVDLPSRDLVVSLTEYRAELARIAEEIAGPRPPERPEGSRGEQASQASMEELAAFATDLLAAGEALIERARAEAAALRSAGEAAENAAREALSSAGVENMTALENAWIEARSALTNAERDLERAEREMPIAESLDQKIGALSGRMGALADVRALVSDSKFIQYVVTRKQTALLGVASALLGSMTRDRYGFSADFEVVDRLTGQARGTRTLSGGETFLASLALALGLVELAGRSGGRLDALFLDEGFGSLDAGALADALGALTRLADRGRIVAVISHLKSVTEHIEKVLHVRPSPEGSRAVWLDPKERDTMLEQDVEQSLLS